MNILTTNNEQPILDDSSKKDEPTRIQSKTNINSQELSQSETSRQLRLQNKQSTLAQIPIKQFQSPLNNFSGGKFQDLNTFKVHLTSQPGAKENQSLSKPKMSKQQIQQINSSKLQVKRDVGTNGLWPEVKQSPDSSEVRSKISSQLATLEDEGDLKIKNKRGNWETDRSVNFVLGTQGMVLGGKGHLTNLPNYGAFKPKNVPVYQSLDMQNRQQKIRMSSEDQAPVNSDLVKNRQYEASLAGTFNITSKTYAMFKHQDRGLSQRKYLEITSLPHPLKSSKSNQDETFISDTMANSPKLHPKNFKSKYFREEGPKQNDPGSYYSPSRQTISKDNYKYENYPYIIAHGCLDKQSSHQSPDISQRESTEALQKVKLKINDGTKNVQMLSQTMSYFNQHIQGTMENDSKPKIQSPMKRGSCRSSKPKEFASRQKNLTMKSVKAKNPYLAKFMKKYPDIGRSQVMGSTQMRVSKDQSVGEREESSDAFKVKMEKFHQTSVDFGKKKSKDTSLVAKVLNKASTNDGTDWPSLAEGSIGHKNEGCQSEKREAILDEEDVKEKKNLEGLAIPSEPKFQFESRPNFKDLTASSIQQADISPQISKSLMPQLTAAKLNATTTQKFEIFGDKQKTEQNSSKLTQIHGYNHPSTQQSKDNHSEHSNWGKSLQKNQSISRFQDKPIDTSRASNYHSNLQSPDLQRDGGKTSRNKKIEKDSKANQTIAVVDEKKQEHQQQETVTIETPFQSTQLIKKEQPLITSVANLSFDHTKSSKVADKSAQQNLQTSRTSKFSAFPKNQNSSVRHKLRLLKPELDFDKVKSKDRYINLPAIFKGKPVETQRSPQPGKGQFDFNLPSEFKFVSDEKASNIDLIRKQIRMNRIHHLKFKPVIGSMEGQKYYSTVYKPNEAVFCSVSPKDIGLKDKICGYSKPLNYKNPAEIDLLQELDVNQQKKAQTSVLNSANNSDQLSIESSIAGARHHEEKHGNHIIVVENSVASEREGVLSPSASIEVRSKRVNHSTIDASSVSKLRDSVQTAPKSVLKSPVLKESEDLNKEKNLYSYLHKTGAVNKLGDLAFQNVKRQKMEFKTETAKTEEQVAIETEFENKLKGLRTKTVFKDFQRQLRKTDTGEFKINLTKSSEIERKTKEKGALQKMQPTNFQGSLRQFIQEVDEKLENGFEFDHEAISKILQKKTEESETATQPLETKETKEMQASRLTKQTNSTYDEITQMLAEGKPVMLSSIEIAHIQDKEREKKKRDQMMQQFMLQQQIMKEKRKEDLEHDDLFTSFQDMDDKEFERQRMIYESSMKTETKMSKKEEYFRRKEQQMKKAESQVSYQQLLEKEKLKIESQRQKMLNQPKIEDIAIERSKQAKEAFQVFRRNSYISSPDARSPPLKSPRNLPTGSVKAQNRSNMTSFKLIKEGSGLTPRDHRRSTSSKRESELRRFEVESNKIDKSRYGGEKSRLLFSNKKIKQRSDMKVTTSQEFCLPVQHLQLPSLDSNKNESNKSEKRSTNNSVSRNFRRTRMAQSGDPGNTGEPSRKSANIQLLLSLEKKRSSSKQLLQGLSSHSSRMSNRNLLMKRVTEMQSPVKIDLMKDGEIQLESSIDSDDLKQQKKDNDKLAPPRQVHHTSTSQVLYTTDESQKGHKKEPTKQEILKKQQEKRQAAPKISVKETKTSTVRKELAQEITAKSPKKNFEFETGKEYEKARNELEREAIENDQYNSRGNLLKNSLTNDFLKCLHIDIPTQVQQANSISRAIAITNLEVMQVDPTQKHSPSNRKQTQITNEIRDLIFETTEKQSKRTYRHKSKLKKREALNLDEKDIAEFTIMMIKSKFTPKFKIEKDYHDHLRRQFRKEAPQISTDITQNRRINFIKNQLRDSDEDIFIEYVENQGNTQQKHSESEQKKKSISPSQGKEANVLRSQLLKQELKKIQHEFKKILLDEEEETSQLSSTSSRRTNARPLKTLTSNKSSESSESLSDLEQNRAQIEMEELIKKSQFEALQSLRAPDNILTKISSRSSTHSSLKSGSKTKVYFPPVRESQVLHVNEQDQGQRMSLSVSKTKKFKRKPKQDILHLYQMLRRELNYELHGPPLEQETLQQIKERMSTVQGKLDTNLASINHDKEHSQGHKEERKIMKQNKNRSFQNRKNMTVLMRALEKQFQAREWLEHFEQKKNHELNNILTEEGRLRNGIENFVYLNSKLNEKNTLVTNIADIIPSILDIMKQNEERDQNDFENFLSPQSVSTFKETSYANTENIVKFEKQSRKEKGAKYHKGTWKKWVAKVLEEGKLHS